MRISTFKPRLRLLSSSPRNPATKLPTITLPKVPTRANQLRRARASQPRRKKTMARRLMTLVWSPRTSSLSWPRPASAERRPSRHSRRMIMILSTVSWH